MPTGVARLRLPWTPEESGHASADARGYIGVDRCDATTSIH
jgi:hypothetical protein